MTLRTVTYDDATHKVVPIEPDDAMINGALETTSELQDCSMAIRRRVLVKGAIRRAIAAAPALPDDAQQRECKCSFAIRALGDGCDVCNPEYAKQLEEDQS